MDTVPVSLQMPHTQWEANPHVCWQRGQGVRVCLCVLPRGVHGSGLNYVTDCYFLYQQQQLLTSQISRPAAVHPDVSYGFPRCDVMVFGHAVT
jgi:hypothetical protein